MRAPTVAVQRATRIMRSLPTRVSRRPDMGEPTMKHRAMGVMASDSHTSL
jgi:hypothetical protein